MFTMLVDFTEHSLLFTCYECTIEQGPSHTLLGHLHSNWAATPVKPRVI